MLEELIRKLKRGSAWGVLARATLAVSSIVSASALAKILTQDELGYYFLFVQTVVVVSLVPKAGMRSSLVKLVGIASDRADGARIRAILGACLRLYVVMSLIAIAGLSLTWVAAGRPLFGPQATLVLLGLLAVALLARAAEELGAAFFRALQQMKPGVLLDGAPREALLALSFVAIWATAGVSRFGTVTKIYAMVAVAVAAATLFLARRRVPPRRSASSSLSRLPLKELAALSLPMALHGAAATVFRSSDILILGVFDSPESVSLFGAANRLTRASSLVLVIANLVLAPMVAVLYSRGEKKQMEHVARTAATWSALVGLVVLLVLLLFGERLLVFVFNPGFADATSILWVLVIGATVHAACGSPGVVLQMTGEHVTLTKITLFTAVVNVVGNLVVVGPYGALGVAWVTAGSIVLQNVVMTTFVRRRVGIWALPFLWPGRRRED